MENTNPQDNDSVILDGQEISYGYLRNTLGLPKDAIIDGCNAVATGKNDEILLQKVYHFSRCLPFDGFSEKSFAKLATGTEILNDPYIVFDEKIIDDDFMKDKGFGPGQIKNFNKARDKYKKIGIKLDKMIQAFGILNCGESISREYAKEYAGLEPDYSGKTMAVVEECHDNFINFANIEERLVGLGYNVIGPQREDPKESAAALVILTGSPKTFGFATKKEFLDQYPNWTETKKWTEADFLITDDLESKSSKMSKAQKSGVQIITYEQAKDLY